MRELKTVRVAERGEHPDWAVLKQPRNQWVNNRMWCETSTAPVSIHDTRDKWYASLGVTVYYRECVRTTSKEEVWIIKGIRFRLDCLSKR